MRVGFLGIRHIHAYSYVRALRILGVDDVQAWDADAAALAEFAGQSDVPAASLTSVLTASDAVIITSTTAEHLSLVRHAASAGLPILLEKPMAVSVQDARDIVDVCEEAGVLLMTAFPLRYSSEAAAIAASVRGKAPGAVVSLRGVNQSVTPTRHDSWFADPELAGGGASMDHVIHLADLYSWWLGEEPDSVRACATSTLGATSGGVAVDSVFTVLLHYPGGTIATIDASWSRRETYPIFGTLEVDATLDDGTLTFDPFRSRVAVHGRANHDERWDLVGDDLDLAMVRDFVECAASGRTPLATGRHGLAATLTTLNARDNATWLATSTR
ncbi:Gfo/Idh/MocA family protein [Streptomyces griseorubiginosus]|uniref:Gfo/Idh/MocA family protein n=1 Tax=Streptomyces griseorubiginosus TaxID=67304 RepID=UPI003691DE1C